MGYNQTCIRRWLWLWANKVNYVLKVIKRISQFLVIDIRWRWVCRIYIVCSNHQYYYIRFFECYGLSLSQVLEQFISSITTITLVICIKIRVGVRSIIKSIFGTNEVNSISILFQFLQKRESIAFVKDFVGVILSNTFCDRISSCHYFDWVATINYW